MFVVSLLRLTTFGFPKKKCNQISNRTTELPKFLTEVTELTKIIKFNQVYPNFNRIKTSSVSFYKKKSKLPEYRTERFDSARF